jgi:transposase-like protein
MDSDEHDRVSDQQDRRAFWELAMGEQKSSGLSVRAFCRREGLGEASFYSWRRRLSERESAAVHDHDPAISFVEVLRSAPASGRQAEVAMNVALEVLLPGGLVVRVSEGFDGPTLRQVVEALS